MEKNKAMMGIIIALLVILLGTVAGLGFYIIKNVNGKNVEASTPQEIPVVDQKDIVTALTIEAITTNLAEGADKNNNHMIKLSISVEVNAAKSVKKDADALLAVLATKDIVVKDILIDVVSNKTYEDLKRTDAKTVVKEEMIKRLQEEFRSNLIVSVNIGEWTVM